MENHSQFGSGSPLLYVCNCNGLRQRDVALAIEAGACRPREIFARNQCQAQCAKCVCEMRQMIDESREAFALAAE
jgi:bacterioferritin-associated ferredoxin